MPPVTQGLDCCSLEGPATGHNHCLLKAWCCKLSRPTACCADPVQRRSACCCCGCCRCCGCMSVCLVCALQCVVAQQLLDQVHVCHDHAPAAVPSQLQGIQGLSDSSNRAAGQEHNCNVSNHTKRLTSHIAAIQLTCHDACHPAAVNKLLIHLTLPSTSAVSATSGTLPLTPPHNRLSAGLNTYPTCCRSPAQHKACETPCNIAVEQRTAAA